MAGGEILARKPLRPDPNGPNSNGVTAPSPEQVQDLMITHFPVRQVTPFGLVGVFCSCGARCTDSWAGHVSNLVESLFNTSAVFNNPEPSPVLNNTTEA